MIAKAGIGITPEQWTEDIERIQDRALSLSLREITEPEQEAMLQLPERMEEIIRVAMEKE